MFTTLIQWFGKALDFVNWLFQEIWRQVGVMFASVWSIIAIWGAAVYLLISKVSQAIGTLSTLIDASLFSGVQSTAGMAGGPLSSGLAIANTFLPIEEGFAMITVFVGIWATLTAYRLIKSWIPTLS